jgi:hypothetical protein
MDFFRFILFGIHSDSWIPEDGVIHQIWEVFSHYFFTCSVIPTVFFFIFWDSKDTDVGYFAIIPQSPKAMLTFFPVCIFSIVLLSSSRIPSSIISTVQPIQQILNFYSGII